MTGDITKDEALMVENITVDGDKPNNVGQCSRDGIDGEATADVSSVPVKIEDSIPETLEIPVIRRPGRPRKNPEKIKRPRGRPPKTIYQEDGVTIAVRKTPTLNEDGTPRKRGRPRKYPPKDPNEPVVKRPRGRPPKKPVDPNVDPSIPIIKRPRGRPRKEVQINVDQSENGLDLTLRRPAGKLFRSPLKVALKSVSAKIIKTESSPRVTPRKEERRKQSRPRKIVGGLEADPTGTILKLGFDSDGDDEPLSTCYQRVIEQKCDLIEKPVEGEISLKTITEGSD